VLAAVDWDFQKRKVSSDYILYDGVAPVVLTESDKVRDVENVLPFNLVELVDFAP
jgi:hypothetical protein